MPTIKLTEKQYHELLYQSTLDFDGQALGDILEMELYSIQGIYLLNITAEKIGELKWRMDTYMNGSLENKEIGAYNMFRNLFNKLEAKEVTV